MERIKSMKRYTLLILLFFAATGWTFAQNTAEACDVWFEQANTAYNSGNYDTAAMMYENILAMDMESASVYYNLGNAYYKMHNYPMAIYYYEKALKLDPSNDDAQTNLAIANLAIVDKIEPMPQPFYVKWWRSARAWLSGNQWAWCSIVFFALLLAALFVFLRSRRIGVRKLGFFMGLVFLMVFAVSVVFSAQLKHAAITQDQAIIMSPTVTVKSSPSDASVDLFVLHEGSKVSVLEQSNGWNKVRIANGSLGWLPEASMRSF